MVATRRHSALGLLFSVASLCFASTAEAGPNDPKLRFQRDLKGDIAVFGSTLAHDCGTKAALPADATVSCAGQVNIDDTAPDIYWRDDVANASIEPLQARTSATLKMPPGSKVIYARLYWGAIKQGSAPDMTATLDWLGGPSTVIQADSSWALPTNLASLPDSHYYQASGDATEFISTWGAGDFRVTDVDGLPLAGLDLDRAFTGWTIVVFYENDTAELRNLALFDGFTYIAPKEGTPKAEVTLSGFLVPPGFDAKMTAFTYEGDFDYGGDSFTINGIKAQDAKNPVSNFFNSSRSILGQADSGAFDVPKLSGEPGIMSGYDLDTVDITSAVKAGDKSAIISAESELDIFILGGFATSIRNKAPEFSIFKTVADLNGGALLPGDEVEYTITVKNNGNDASINTTLTDLLEPGLEFVAGSLRIEGAPKTDAVGDDAASYQAGSNLITWNIGEGSGAGAGGKVKVGDSVTVSFRAKIAADKENGSVANQAVLQAAGEAGGPKKEWLSDGDPEEVGAQKTVITIKECQTDKDCGADLTKPHCNTQTFTCEPCKTDTDCSNPLLPACQADGSCNECSKTNDDACKDPRPVCNVSSGVCTICTPTTPESPGDATKCVGNPDGTACVIGSDNTPFCGCTKDGDCGDAKSGKVCDTAKTLKCIDGCRGQGGNGCPDTLACTSKDSSIGKCVSNPEDNDAKCSDGLDNDGDGKIDCEDSDCKTISVSVCRENTDAKCSDGKDNDGDSKIDCEDTDCKNNGAVTVCKEKEDTNDKCKDGKDNDSDGAVDCDDPDCKVEGITACAANPEDTDAECSDGKDNDGDGQIDCADADCKTAKVTVCADKTENSADRCKDTIDNDGDGLVDCADQNCKDAGVPFCGDENTDAKCSDKIDNDGDGKVDCDDTNCSENKDVTVCPSPENTNDKCKDGVDNDKNGKIDCDDPACHAQGLTACAENTDDKCKDGKDNDGNGKADCDDPACLAKGLTACAENTDDKCKDGKDNDGNGKTDCDDPACLAKGLTACADPSGGKGELENTNAKCSDKIDNDGDGKVDCADSDCFGPTVTICDAGSPADSDQDGACGCVVPGREAPASGSALLLGLAGLGALAARRRRGR